MPAPQPEPDPGTSAADRAASSVERARQLDGQSETPIGDGDTRAPERAGGEASFEEQTLVNARVLRDAQDDLALFKFLSLNAVDAQVLLDDESRVAYVNSAAARLLGRDGKWLEKRAWRELIDVDLARLLESACAHQSRMEEVVIEDPKRGPRTAEISAKSVQFRGKRYCFVSLRDVTARKVSERRLLVEHGVAAALVDAGTVADGFARTLEEFVVGFELFVAEVWTSTGDELVLEQQRFGPRATQSERWSRVSRDARSRRGVGLIGRIRESRQPVWIDDLGEQQDLTRHQEASALGLRTAFGFPIVDEGECVAVFACFSRAPIESDEGLTNLVASVRRVLEQFVRRVRIERALWLHSRAIEETREGIVICDALADDAPIVYVNSGFELLTGYAREEALGRNCRFLQGPDTDPQARAQLREALAARRECRVTLLNYARDGRTFWNDLEIAPVRDERGLVTHFVAVQHDVSELKRIQEELRQAHVLAQAASAAKSEFLANVSHEIRTPLSTILGFCDILLERTRERESVEDLRAIRRSGAYLAELIEDILDLSRIEAGKLRIQRQTFALAELVLDLDALMQVRALERGLPLTFEFTTDAPVAITSDRVRLRQILVNLIGNALKFTDRGQVRVLISLADDTPDARLQFAVVDTGPGIGSEDFERIFQPFTQASSTAERHGAGLGLTISRRLAGELAGTITVESELGVGTRFTLSLPIGSLEGVAVRRPDLRAAALGSRERRVEGSFVGCRALVVDDLDDVRRVVAHFLGLGGAQVETAANGTEALAQYERASASSQPFDVVLIDIGLPGMRGDQVIAELRRRGCDRPILAVTAAAMKDERERWLEAGCDEVIAKPIDGIALVRSVAGHLARRARLRRHFEGESPADADVAIAVLVVEDDVDAAESTRRLLESRGARVQVAHSGREALDEYRMQIPELVLIDLRLGDIDGFSLAESLRADAREPQPMLVAVSGFSDSEDAERARAAGMERLLVKPVDPEHLYALLERARQRRRG